MQDAAPGSKKSQKYIRLGKERIENSPVEDLEMLADKKLNTAQKANCNKTGVVTREWEV